MSTEIFDVIRKDYGFKLDTALEYTEKKYFEYTGEELTVTMYSDVSEYLEAGDYKLFIFCDSQMIGQTNFTLK